MKKIARMVEIPREWTKARVQEMYPGFTVVGAPFGYFHAVQETRCVFVDYSWGEVLKAVKAHLTGNGLPVPADLNLQMMDHWCEITSSPLCAEEDLLMDERRSFMDMSAQFLRAMQDVAHNGTVDQAEAERRASICATCDFNKEAQFSQCFGCSAQTAAAKIAKMVLGKSTTKDSLLKYCRVCHCKLDLKVWPHKDSMDTPNLRAKWPSFCWMK